MMFDPKITPGPWKWDKYGLEYEVIGQDYEEVTLISPVIPNYENHFAVLAVPELLEVYKASKEFFAELDKHLNPENIKNTHVAPLLKADRELREAIKKLEDIHCQ